MHDGEHAREHEHEHEHDLRGQIPSGHEHDDHAHDAPLLRCDWCRGWRECWPHSHASRCGTPYVHSFLTEPAFLGRDVFLDVGGAGGETEIESEVEWALTRRLGLIAELPFADTDAETGLGDAALGLRALLVETERFLLASSIEVEIPTGDETRDLGRGDWALGGSVHTWHDLGKCFTLQSQLGVEGVPETGDAGFLWSLTLVKSFIVRPLFGSSGGGHAHGRGHDHGPDAISLHAEVAGETGLAGDESGSTEGLWLVGVQGPVTNAVDLRGAFTRTFDGIEGWRLGIVIHL